MSTTFTFTKAQYDEMNATIQALLDWKAASDSAAAAASPISAGDTAWMLTSTALVLLMSLPGLALFYGGMSQAKNVLSTVVQTLSIACMISVLWFMMTYSLCFTTGSPVMGGASRFWLIGTTDTSNQKSPNRMGLTSVHPLAPTIPESVFMTFQLTFAIITAAIVCGSFAERMKFTSMITFIFIWHFLVYCPVCHSEWATDGFLSIAGDLDFAGGNVVHISSGFSGLAASLIVGSRRGFGTETLRPHNIVYSVIGASMLWVGWFGFNAGSAVTSGTSAGFAMMVTQICTGTCGFTWMVMELILQGRATMLGIVSGAVTGLVVITPACGFVDQTAAFVMGVIGAPVVYYGVRLKHALGYDDALDAFGVHGLGGVTGGILTGFFANDFVTGLDNKKGVFYGRGVQLGLQLYGMVVIAAWSFFMSAIILFALKFTIGLRVSAEDEHKGLDLSERLDDSEHPDFVVEVAKPTAPVAVSSEGSGDQPTPPPQAGGPSDPTLAAVRPTSASKQAWSDGGP